MANKTHRTTPSASKQMPGGIPFIIGNEAAERFSFYGMRTILVVFMVKYLWLMGDKAGVPMSGAEASEKFHLFAGLVYLTPFLGALLADFFVGKYRVIIWLSLVYCLGHASLAMMGTVGRAEMWLSLGLWLIIFGSGGIKPCVSAHVGDQFGPNNQHLLTKIFNWFYFSINLGAFVSSLLTPWLLDWYGPHLAFGIPGVLMLIATICFWAGRYRFVHVPAKPANFLKDLTSRDGLIALGKLTIIYFFIAVFWALFDQTGSSWVIQAEDMDRNLLGIEWLPSQIQAINPILILIFIPIFTIYIYPAVERVFPLPALRKISIGLFIMVLAFGIVAFAQEKIDAGLTPSVMWQIVAYIVITTSEVMVSIVCLDFSYKQAPRSLKSFVMALFWGAVFVGNIFTAKVNKFIQVEAPVAVNWEDEAGDKKRFAGFDGKEGTDDDIIVFRKGDLEFSGQAGLKQLVAKVENAVAENGHSVLDSETGSALVSQVKDPWGNPYRYSLVNSRQCRVSSTGPDGVYMTKWDQGVVLEVMVPVEKKKAGKISSALHPKTSWIERRKKELGLLTSEDLAKNGPSISARYFVGGQTKLEGAPYFWFFTKLMLGAAVIFLFVSIIYKPKAYIYEEGQLSDE